MLAKTRANTRAKMTKLKDACMALLAMLIIILFPNMEDV